MSKMTKTVTATILSMSLLTVMAAAAIAPAMGIIRQHFASAPDMLVQLIISLPALFIILTNLLFLPISRVLRTRAIAIIGLVLYVAAGTGCFFVDNIHLLLLMRALLGVSVGLIMPLSTGLLSYFYPPEEQARLMGLSAAMNQMGGVVGILLAGMLAFFVGLVFGHLMHRFRTSIKFFPPIVLIIGYAFYAEASNVAMLLIGSAFIGVGNGIGVPYLLTIASIKGGKNSATTVMPLLSASLYLGQFISPILILPLVELLFGSHDVTGPYRVAVLISLLFLLQVWMTRRFQSLPPED